MRGTSRIRERVATARGVTVFLVGLSSGGGALNPVKRLVCKAAPLRSENLEVLRGYLGASPQFAPPRREPKPVLRNADVAAPAVRSRRGQRPRV